MSLQQALAEIEEDPMLTALPNQLTLLDSQPDITGSGSLFTATTASPPNGRVLLVKVGEQHARKSYSRQLKVFWEKSLINRTSRFSIWILAVFVVATATQKVYADSATTAAYSTGTVSAPDATSNSLDEIIVTARRRSEDLSKTPVAVSVLGGDALDKLQILTQSDLQTAIPGVTIRATDNSNQLNYSIRGQSLDAFSTSQPGVLPYVNEVPVGGAGGSTAFYDLDSIQVLKGPQGTLFGRNATGGAVLFTTVKPKDDFEGYFDARLGDYNLKQFEGAVNIPIVSDRLVARVAGFYEKQDGFQTNLYYSNTLGDIDRYGLRGSLTARVGDNFQSDLVGEYFHSGGNSLTSVLNSLNPNGLIPAILLFSPALDTVYGPGAWAAYLAAHPRAPAGGLAAFLPVQLARGPFTVDVDGSNAHLANNLVLSDISTLKIADETTLKNVLGFNSLRSIDFTEVDGSPYGIVDNGEAGEAQGGQLNNTHELSEELQLAGKILRDLSYVSGLYFEDERIDEETVTRSLDLAPIMDPSFDTHDALLRNRTFAVYGEGTYDLGELTGIHGLGVTAGARYSVERHTVQFLPGDSGFDVPDSPTYQKYQENTDHETSWHFGLQEQINSDLLVYVTTRKSFRDGGYNWLYGPQVGLGSVGGDRYLPETARDVELGTKFQGSIANVPTRLDFALYSMTVDNVQRVDYVLVGGNIAAVTVNVPQAKIQGFDADGQINPLSWLKLGAALSYADARFSENVAFVQGNPTPTAFGPYPDTPRWSGSIFTDVTFRVYANRAVSIHGDLYDQTGTYFTSTFNTINPGTFIPGYVVANFRVGLEDSKQGWTVSANVKNALNRVYYVGGIGTSNLTSTNAVVPGAPRTFSVDIRYKF
jgi:iron complex outermembrane receptor protein